MDKGKYQRKQLQIRKHTIIIITSMLLPVMIGGVFAKYVYDNAGSNLLSAKEFYFTSNLLKEEGSKYVLNSTATEISFTLGNSADKLRCSQDDIIYDISVTNKSGGTVPEIIDGNTEHKLLGGSVSQVTITLTNLEKGETYIVTSTGKAGYKQTLMAEFTVSENEENVYKHLEISTDNAYLLFTIWTENVVGELQVVTPAGLIPDNTNPILREVYNYSGAEYGEIIFTDKINFDQTYSSYTYRFFVSDGSFNIDDFQVSIYKNGIEYPAEKADIPK